MGTTEQNKDLMKDLYDLDFLIPLVLLRGKLSGMKEGLVRFKIAKIAAWLLVSSEISSVQEGVFLYRFGPYLLGFEDALADLVRKNILEVIIDAGGQTRFCLTDEGQRCVLKIANANETEEFLQLQNQTMIHLSNINPSLNIPRIILTKANERITSQEKGSQRTHFVRLLSYLPGKVFAKVNPHTDQLLQEFGRFMAGINSALQSFDHPAAYRDFYWA